jgi:quercetin 2,3-dioxygenase
MTHITRRISQVIATPPAIPGFIGDGHTAVEVVASDALAATDPFVLLMDDRLDMPKQRVIGDAHPHAGLETVTLILEGSLLDRDEGALSAGDVVWMTAGRGIIHNEHVEAGGKVRVLQLWLRLPARDRVLAPSFEVIRGANAPVRREPGVVARLYSGTTGDLTSPTRNRVPITLVDLALEPGATFVQETPASYNGFAYVIDGDAVIGGARVGKGEVGWTDRPDGDSWSTLAFTAGNRGARIVLYLGEPQREALVQKGPFVAGSPVEITELYRRFRAGDFQPLSTLTREQGVRP